MSTIWSTLFKVRSFSNVIFSMTFSMPSTLEIDEFLMYKCSPSTFYKWKNLLLNTHMSCCTIINFETLFMKSLTSVNNQSLFRVPLLRPIFIILSWVFNLFIDKTFVIELFSNSLLLYDKFFLLVFILGLCSLFNDICHKSHARRVGSSSK
jgi:hypothetical protein